MKNLLPLAPFLFQFFFTLTATAGGFDLQINDVSGLEAPWPLVGSLAFPRGELKDPGSIRIMSGNREIPSQVDVTASWRDGSIRWALAGFTASPQGSYRVEFGNGVSRAPHPRPLQVLRQPGGGFTVDTGAAFYTFESDNLLPENGWLFSAGQRVQILEGSGAGAYLVDNSGRTARVAGAAAEVENEVLKEGPGRFVVKRSGWYVTEHGEKLAKARVWIYFAQGSPHVRITHSIIFTEDTNQVWFRDYGLEFRTPDLPLNVYCAQGLPGEEQVSKVESGGREIFLLQDTYPHFAERDYRAVIGSFDGREETVIEEFSVAGDWAHGDYGGYGITLVQPWLSERFPKEISFGERGARAVLWSGRSDRELDFRAKTLVDEYWQTWAKKGQGSPGVEKLSQWESNAQGAARTHDIWFLPHVGGYNGELVLKSAVAGARQPLTLSDPEWLCQTDAMGFPMLHKSPEKFPEAEAVISEYWQRFILPLKFFPFNGFISWGQFPLWSYTRVDGKIMGVFQILSESDPYGFRREPWVLYARSGERTYFDHAYRFNRFTGDWYMAHTNAQGKEKGAFVTSSGTRGGRHVPFFWGNRTVRYYMSSGVISNWLFEYYLAGDESSKDLVNIVKDAFTSKWDPANFRPPTPIKVLRTLVSLSIMEWDSEINKVTNNLARSFIDMGSQNSLHINASGAYGPMYKDSRNARNLIEYYLETGDELAKDAFIKLMDQRYRFDRMFNQVGYKSYEGFTGSVAYWLSGDERYRTLAEQTVRDALRCVAARPLAEEIENMPPDPLDWGRLPAHSGTYLGIWEYHNPFMGLPTALKLIAEKGWSDKTFPVAVKPMKVTGEKVLFKHTKGKATTLSMYFQTENNGVEVSVEPYPPKDANKQVQGVTVEMEKRMPLGPFFDSPESQIQPGYYHAYITVPAEVGSGLYLLSADKEDTFTVLDANTAKVALYCPEGFWSVSRGEHAGSMPYGRLGEGMPLYFRVPDELENLKIFISLPARIKRQDGSIALEMSNTNVGNISLPVNGKGGIWEIESFIRYFKGNCQAAFYRLLNVEPIVSIGSPDFLPEIMDSRPADVLLQSEKPSDTLEFPEGIKGLCLQLSGERMVQFPRGAKLPSGGYAHFPVEKGTVEFWFRSDYSTHEQVLPLFHGIDMVFLGAPHINLKHHFWRRGGREINSFLQAEIVPEKGASRNGFQGRHYFRKGEWTHIAYTWDIKKSAEGVEGELAIFVNGKKLPYGRAAHGVDLLAGKKRINLSEEGENIVLGPFDGSMDILRISDIVRYADNFIPAERPPDMDKNTRALFLFDGTLEGVSAFSEQPLMLE